MTGAPRSRRLLLLSLLAIVSIAPVLVLVARGLAPAWRYPVLVPGFAGAMSSFALLRSPRLVDALLSSVTLAVTTGALSVVIGFVAGRAIWRAPARTRRLAAMAAFLPVIAPPVAFGVGVQVLALRLGVGSSWPGVLLAHLVPASGYVTLYILGALSAYDGALEDEARTLGATPWQVLLRVAIPVLRARLVEGAALGALVSWGQLSVTLLVGGAAVRTLPVELLGFVRSGDDRLGAIAALLLALPPVVAFALLERGARRTGVAT